MSQWYVVVALRQQEKRAKEQLENQGFKVYLPMYCSEWAKVPKIQPFLAPYLFVSIDLNDRNSRWQAVYSTRGVRSVISSGDRPQSVANWIIDEIKAREVDGLVKLRPGFHCRFAKGDAVLMKGSLMAAIFDEPVDNRRAAIFLSLLGRQSRIVVPLSRLGALSETRLT